MKNPRLMKWLLFVAMVLILPSFWYSFFWVGVFPPAVIFVITFLSFDNTFLFLINAIESLVYGLVYYGLAWLLVDKIKEGASGLRVLWTSVVLGLIFIVGALPIYWSLGPGPSHDSSVNVYRFYVDTLNTLRMP